MSLDESEVLAFLQSRPEWLSQHAAEFNLRPSESKILSFQQGNLLALKRKTEKMATQLVQMLSDAEANHRLIAKIQAFDQRLLAVNTITQWQQAVTQGLSEDFSLPHHAINIVATVPKNVRVPNKLLAEGAVKVVAEKLVEPLCGVMPAVSLLQLLPSQSRLESFLQLPLRWQNQTIGILIIGHEDISHFQVNQAVDWVSALADSIAIVLARLLKLVR